MKNIILKSMLLLWTVFAVLSCDDLLEEKVYDFILQSSWEIARVRSLNY